MNMDFHALSISFAVCSLLNGCSQTSDGSQGNAPTNAYIEDKKLAGGPIVNAQERSRLRQKMLSMKSYEECTSYVELHDQMMLEEAQEKGSSRPLSRKDICHRMKSAGMFR